MSRKKEHDHDGHRIRMRQRYQSEGFDGFAEHEVLEMLLFYCYPQGNTNNIAHGMVKKFGSLHNLLETDVKTLMATLGCTERIAVLLNMIPALANRYFRSKWGTGTVLDNEKAAGEYATDLFVGHTVESLYVLCLDKKFKLINTSLISKGTIDQSTVYLREVAHAALRNNAVNIILTHNHPGGSAKPSRNDLDVTRHAFETLAPIDIDVVDHIIIAGDTYYSFSVRGQHVKGYL